MTPAIEVLSWGILFLFVMAAIMIITKITGEEDDVNVHLLTIALGSFGIMFTLMGLAGIFK